MAGIVGIASEKQIPLVEKALTRLAHRGSAGRMVLCKQGVTFGIVWPKVQESFAHRTNEQSVIMDGELYNWPNLAEDTCPLEAIENAYRVSGPAFLKLLDGPFALAIAGSNGFFLARDVVGITPLYYGKYQGNLCFASEAKALIGWAENITEFPPGHYFQSDVGLVQYDSIEQAASFNESADVVASGLRARLHAAVQKRIAHGDVGAWLSGGMDSAALTALAAREVAGFHTFAVGMADSSDLKYAREAANFCSAKHHEKIVSVKEALAALPEVIYHLESFDALLVRSSVMNFLVGKLAAEHVPAVLSGEGGDELFAGYDYLKELPLAALPAELLDITHRLHNTALQRVDRCSAAHGLVARTGFLDKSVISYALQTPPEMKLRRNGAVIEKWILRRAMAGLLPESVLQRPKEKFWQGAGVGDALASRAEETISDEDFQSERMVTETISLCTKEELMCYRIFREQFGDKFDPALVGRTKGAPRVP